MKTRTKILCSFLGIAFIAMILGFGGIVPTSTLVGIGAAWALIAFSNRAAQRLGSVREELLNEKAMSLSMMERILHAMDDHIYVTELETDKILFINDSMAKDFNLTGDVKGESCWKFFQLGFDKRCDFCPKRKLEANPDEPVVWEELNKITGRRYRKIDRVIDWPDGTKVHLQQSDDTTELAEALALEKQSKSELITAMKLAEQGNRVKSEFMSRINHEMLTPMNAIMGMAQIAQMQSDPESRKECLDEIAQASSQLLRLINDVLDMSSIEGGAFTLTDSFFSFSMMLQDALRTVGGYVNEKQHTLILDLDPSIPISLIGDEKHLSQVIINLLTNAVKFTPENGEIRFAVRVLDEKDGIVTLQIEVTDNGIGMSKEQQKKIFSVFEQVDGSPSSKYDGIGLGLALSKRIVEFMGGAIWVDSELGKGSKFTFTCKLQRSYGHVSQLGRATA